MGGHIEKWLVNKVLAGQEAGLELGFPVPREKDSTAAHTCIPSARKVQAKISMARQSGQLVSPEFRVTPLSPKKAAIFDGGSHL